MHNERIVAILLEIQADYHERSTHLDELDKQLSKAKELVTEIQGKRKKVRAQIDGLMKKMRDPGAYLVYGDDALPPELPAITPVAASAPPEPAPGTAYRPLDRPPGPAEGSPAPEPGTWTAWQLVPLLELDGLSPGASQEEYRARRKADGAIAGKIERHLGTGGAPAVALDLAFWLDDGGHSLEELPLEPAELNHLRGALYLFRERYRWPEHVVYPAGIPLAAIRPNPEARRGLQEPPGALEAKSGASGRPKGRQGRQGAPVRPRQAPKAITTE